MTVLMIATLFTLNCLEVKTFHTDGLFRHWGDIHFQKLHIDHQFQVNKHIYISRYPDGFKLFSIFVHIPRGSCSTVDEKNKEESVCEKAN
jgi:hypothetical protein